METDNLRTASVYINNLLLSRGLLKNGQNLDFAHPEQGEGGSEGTMGRIMGVVNDLILRRDVRSSSLFPSLTHTPPRDQITNRTPARRNPARKPLQHPPHPPRRLPPPNHRPHPPANQALRSTAQTRSLRSDRASTKSAITRRGGRGEGAARGDGPDARACWAGEGAVRE